MHRTRRIHVSGQDNETPLNTSRELLSGWGRVGATAATVSRPSSLAQIESLITAAREAKKAVLARGLGRSYGDAAQCAGGSVIDCTGLDKILDTDFVSGTIRVEAGCSLSSLLAVIIPEGWFIPVTPGTSHITVGGAIASDVHGKNHHRDGSFSNFVVRATLRTATSSIEISAIENSEVFWATVGGMGLTGIVIDATLRLVPIETSRISVDTNRTSDLDACMALLDSGDAGYRYSVAWVDCLARGASLGRAVLTRGEHARLDALDTKDREHPLAVARDAKLALPVVPPISLVNGASVRAFNELYWRRAPRERVEELQSYSSFFYPLDVAKYWNRLYGPRGFTQYQFVVPFDASEVVRRAIELMQRSKAVPSLAVLKRFGKASEAPLSFPMPGWTLAADLPLGGVDVAPVLDALDDLVESVGGRVYLTKDGRLAGSRVARMYPELGRWREQRRLVDPDGLFRSDLSRRLELAVPTAEKA